MVESRGALCPPPIGNSRVGLTVWWVFISTLLGHLALAFAVAALVPTLAPALP